MERLKRPLCCQLPSLYPFLPQQRVDKGPHPCRCNCYASTDVSRYSNQSEISTKASEVRQSETLRLVQREHDRQIGRLQRQLLTHSDRLYCGVNDDRTRHFNDPTYISEQFWMAHQADIIISFLNASKGPFLRLVITSGSLGNLETGEIGVGVFMKEISILVYLEK